MPDVSTVIEQVNIAIDHGSILATDWRFFVFNISQGRLAIVVFVGSWSRHCLYARSLKGLNKFPNIPCDIQVLFWWHACQNHTDHHRRVTGPRLGVGTPRGAAVPLWRLPKTETDRSGNPRQVENRNLGNSANFIPFPHPSRNAIRARSAYATQPPASSTLQYSETYQIRVKGRFQKLPVGRWPVIQL